jgi:hypothetical protein
MNTKLTTLLLIAASQALMHAAPVEYVATLSGAAEVIPNLSPGTGSAMVDFDTTAHTMRVQVSFADLLGTTTASHIHAPTAVPLTGSAGVATGVPTFFGFPLGVHSGTYDHTFDLSDVSTYNPTYVVANGGTPAGAEAALASALAAGTSYLNIHTIYNSPDFLAGEIRGFLVAATVPDAGASASLLLLGLAGLRLFRRTR